MTLTLLVAAAFVATLVAFAFGIASMVYDAEAGHGTSVQWMGRRVGFQALAVLLILIALLMAT
jgi:hypothetical protein